MNWRNAVMSCCVWWQVAEQVGKVEGVKKVLLAESDVFKGLLPGKLALSVTLESTVVAELLDCC